MKTLWDFFIQEYGEHVNLPTYVIDYIAIYPIILNCAMGLSNDRIASRHDLPEQYIEDVLLQYLNVSGWKLDLDFSPIALYNRSKGVYNAYCQEIDVISAVEFNEQLKKQTFVICEKVSNIKEILKEYGY